MLELINTAYQMQGLHDPMFYPGIIITHHSYQTTPKCLQHCVRVG